MSLIAWYPLNGDTLDYSGNGVVSTITTNPIYSGDGKIGRCMTTGAFTLPSGVLNKNLQSICFWYYNTQSAPSTTGSHQISGGSTRYYGLWSYPNNNDLHYSFYDETTKTNKIAGVVNEVLACEEWTHVCLVNNNLLFSIYINGNLISTFSTNSWDRDFNSAPYQLIHSSSYHRLNDVRIYDHALSTKEIRELAKAKILHYTFDDFQEPTENLTQNILGYYAPYHTVVQSGNNFTCTMIGANKFIVMNLASLGPLTTRTFSYSGTMKKNGIPYVPNNTRFNTYNSAGSITNQIVNTETGYFEGTMYYNHATSNWLLHWPVNNNDGDIITITDFQIEEKDHVTPFTPDTREGVVKDVSGYNNHAPLALTTTPTWTEDSKIGGGAYEFNRSNYINTGVPMKSELFARDDSAYTFSSWIKINEFPSYDATIIGGAYYSGFAIVVNASGRIRTYYRNSVGQYGTTSFTAALGQWYYVCSVLDKSNLKILLYVNGALVGNSSVSNGSFGQESMIFQINRRQQTGGNYFDTCGCNVDDVRIYATALSEEDIKELYQTRMCMHKNGLIAHNFIETNTWEPSIKANNLVVNGCQEMENNYNFSQFTYDAKNKCLSRQSGSSTLSSNLYIPINKDHSFKLSGEFKDGNGIPSRYYYGFHCYDKDFKEITHQMVTFYTSTKTTLAQPLNNGDTTVALTSSANWRTDNPGVYAHYKCIGFWGGQSEYPSYTYTRTTAHYLTVTGNTLTLRYTWNGGYVPAGTPVANMYSGSTYMYSGAVNPLTTPEWVRRESGLITGWGQNSSTTWRYGTEYVKLMFLINRNATGTPNTLVKNLQFWNTTTGQNAKLDSYSPQLKPTGVFNTNKINEIGLPARYIRDTINGSTANTGNHWVEVQAYDTNGTNLALCRNATSSLLTDGNTGTSPYYSTGIAGVGGRYVEVDLGRICDIKEVRVWHYYGDRRTYHNNRTEVSADGVSWTTVFDSDVEGEYPESPEGHSIILRPQHTFITEDGIIYSREFKEV